MKHIARLYFSICADIATETESAVAQQTVFHDTLYPSQLILPIVLLKLAKELQ